MQAKKPVVGVVIAGGRSLRFGGEKAVALFDGQPMLLRAAARLSRACTHVAINARAGTGAAAMAQAHGFEVLHDAVGDPDGPLAGVKAGLAWGQSLGAATLAVSPCDAPLLRTTFNLRLVAEAEAGAAMAETVDGRQPLCAVWPASALPAVSLALAGGKHPPTWRLLEQVGAVRVRFEPATAFANVNTREELALLEAAGVGATSGRNRR